MSDQTAIRLQNLVGVLLFLAALLLPWFGLRTIVRVLRRQPTIPRRVGISLASILALLASSLGLVLTVCTYPGKPGSGAVARAAQNRAEAIVELLTTSKAITGRYPASLHAVEPSGLPDTVLPRFAAIVGDSLGYRTDSAGRGFELSFSYTGPGRNHCQRTDTSATWHCNGYF